MNWKQIISSSAATGALLATLVAILMVKIGLEPPTFGSALAIFIGMVLISAWAVKKIALTNGWCTPSLKQLIPVSFLTFIIPLLGSSFGAPNSDLDTLFVIILLGTIGGIFWSIPFALWAFFRGSKSSEDATPDTVKFTESE